MDIETTINEIYKYYPRNCSPFSAEYDFAIETKRKKIETLQRKNGINNRWEQLVEKLKNELGLMAVTDESGICDNKFCNYVTCLSGTQNIYLKFHVLLSLVAPFHSVLVSVYTVPDQQHLITSDYEDLEPVLANHGGQFTQIKQNVNSINEQVLKIFNTEQVKKTKLEKIIIPDIALQSKEFGKVTLFDCLFTDYLSTY